MDILHSKQRAFLRALANKMTATVQIGKGCFTEQTAIDIDNQLEVRELVKIHVLRTADDPVKSMASAAAEACRASVVQVVGRTIILYRPSRKLRESGKQIVLPYVVHRNK